MQGTREGTEWSDEFKNDVNQTIWCLNSHQTQPNWIPMGGQTGLTAQDIQDSTIHMCCTLEQNLLQTKPHWRVRSFRPFYCFFILLLLIFLLLSYRFIICLMLTFTLKKTYYFFYFLYQQSHVCNLTFNPGLNDGNFIHLVSKQNHPF